MSKPCEPDIGNYTFDVSLVFVGPSGAGKSSLLQSIYGWYKNVGVHIKTKKISPGFDCMIRGLKDECARCSCDKDIKKDEDDEKPGDRHALGEKKEHKENLDMIFERSGGTYDMELPTSWFASYVWPTFYERQHMNRYLQSDGEIENHKKEIFEKGTITIHMSENHNNIENADILALKDPKMQTCRHLAIVHLISLNKIEFDSSLSYFTRSVVGSPIFVKTASERSRNYRCVAYTKADTYRDGGVLPSIASILADVRKSPKVCTNNIDTVDMLEKSKFFKFISCANDVSVYDHSFGSLRFFFDLLGKLLHLDMSTHYIERRPNKACVNNDESTADKNHKNTGERNHVGPIKTPNDEGCCYQ